MLMKNKSRMITFSRLSCRQFITSTYKLATVGTMAQSNGAHPDAAVHHEATGLAKETVDAHRDPKPLKLFSGWFCPFVQRAWMILEEKGIPYEYIEVNPYNRPKALTDLNPRGLVPTLQVHDRPLYESTVISEFLEEAYCSYPPNLNPKDLVDRGQMRIWSDWVTSRFTPAFFRFLQAQPDADGGKVLEKARQEFLDLIKEFTKEMHPTGPYFMGEEIQMVDFIMAPWAIRLWVFDHFKKGGLGMPMEGESGEDEKTWARWRKYAKAIEERKSVKYTLSDKERYLPIYQRYADDKAQSEMAKATRAGRGVP